MAAVVFAAAALVGTRLVETLAVVNGSRAGELAVYTRLIVGDGATALLGAVLSGLALVATTAESRPWVRPLSMAALLVSVVAIIVAVVTFFLMPAPQPQPPGMG